MKLSQIQLDPVGWVEPKLPPLCGPGEFADYLIRRRDAWSEVDYGPHLDYPTSDLGLRELVTLCFFASLTPEEGRFSQFNAADFIHEGRRTIALFESRIPLDSIGPLRRLAPACASPDYALRIVEDDARLWCDGIANISSMGYDTWPGVFGYSSVGWESSFQLFVRGPGHLIGGTGTDMHELREGRIASVTPLRAAPPIKEAIAEIARSLHARAIKQEGEDSRCYGGESAFESIVERVLLSMVRFAVEARHGGTIVILPAGERGLDRFKESLNPTYRATLDVGQEILDFWGSCVRAGRLRDKEGHYQVTTIANRFHTQLWTRVNALANLVAVDGCVVINRELQLCGFGAEILNRDGVSPRSLKTTGTREIIEVESIGGMRHRSAIRLCMMHDGLVALVISQDGDVKVFHTSGDDVFGFCNLAAVES